MARSTALGLRLRAFYFVAVAVLASTALLGTDAFAQRGGIHVGGAARVGAPRSFPRRPIYRLGPISPAFIPGFGFWGGPYFGFGLGLGLGPIGWQNCLLYGQYGCNLLPPYYYFYGEGERDLAQLYLNDGTVYNVTDYWLVDTQLHFKTVEEDGSKVVEHTIDFNQLDLQKTIDADTQRGFRFVLRNEPIEQYLRDHPEIGAPSPAPNAVPAGPVPPSAPPASESPQQPQ